MNYFGHGIGGLLAAVDTAGTVSTSDDRAWWYTYDANGNVGQLLRHDAATGAVTLAAAYEYDPYGNTLRADDLDGSGSAQANKFRFSTKYLHDELTAPGQHGALAATGLYYYGYRFYSPELGKWISRDPIGEEGGVNLCGFVLNDPIGVFDILGESATSQPSTQPEEAPERLCPCPPNTCDRWKLTVIGVGTKTSKKVKPKGKAVITAGALHAQLDADPACPMRTHSAAYQFVGVGVGVGLSITGQLSVNSATFNTECIEWNDHAGPGRLATAGIGIWWVYGTLVTVTPQTNQTFTGWGRGIDFAAAETIGIWAVHLH